MFGIFGQPYPASRHLLTYRQITKASASASDLPSAHSEPGQICLERSSPSVPTGRSTSMPPIPPPSFRPSSPFHYHSDAPVANRGPEVHELEALLFASPLRSVARSSWSLLLRSPIVSAEAPPSPRAAFPLRSYALSSPVVGVSATPLPTCSTRPVALAPLLDRHPAM